MAWKTIQPPIYDENGEPLGGAKETIWKTIQPANNNIDYEQQKQPESVFRKFIDVVEGIGKGFARDAVSFGLSARELARPSNIFRNPISNPQPAKDTEVNVFGEKVLSIQRNMDIASDKYKRGEINTKQLLGEAGSQALIPLMAIPMGEAANVAKEGAKYGLAEAAKEIGKESIKYGGSFGFASGAAEAMKQNAPWKEVARTGAIGSVAGSATMFGLGVGGRTLGKIIAKDYKKPPLAEKVDEIKKRYEPKKTVEKAEEIAIEKEQKNTQKKKKEDRLNIRDIINRDKDITIKETENKIKIPDRDKFAAGKYHYNFKNGKGEIVIRKGAKDSTIAHEYAHHLNFKFGEGDKFSNKLSNYIEGRGNKPKILGDFDAKKLRFEMKKAARITRNAERRLVTPSEEFATAISNLIERPEEVKKTAPLFYKFAKEKILKVGEKPMQMEKGLISGKNIKWSEKEDRAAEQYIRNKGIDKARKSAKLKELQRHYKSLQKRWDNASARERKNISKAMADIQRRISDQKFRVDKKTVGTYLKIIDDALREINQDKFLKKYSPEPSPKQVKDKNFDLENKEYSKEAHGEAEIKKLTPFEHKRFKDVVKSKKSKSYVKKLKNFLIKNPDKDLHPVLIEGTIENKEYYPMVVDGHHRMQAYIEAGRKTIPIQYNRKTLKEIHDFYNPEKFKLKTQKFRTEEGVTLKTLDRIKEDIKKPVVSKQALLAYANRGDIKQAERDIIRQVLDEMPEGKVSVQEFVDKVKSELIPLKTISSEKGVTTYDPKKSLGSPRYENVTLPDNVRGNVANYTEHVYTSPIETSAGDVHFSNGAGSPSSIKNYFAHTRIEDMADGKTRRLIEAQSDLFQKGRLESDRLLKEGSDLGGGYTLQTIDRFGNTKVVKKRKITKDLQQLRPYRNTWHERIIREEIKRAAQDGKTKLQFPTGETAMKIEGLGDVKNWQLINKIDSPTPLNKDNLRVGEKISDNWREYFEDDGVSKKEWKDTIDANTWIVTEVLDDGKFKAVPKNKWDEYQSDLAKLKGKKGTESTQEAVKRVMQQSAEEFDISGKVDTKNPIYKFYEKDVQKFLKKTHPEMKKVTDKNGVTWFEINPKKEEGTAPVQAFRKAKEKIQTIAGKKLTERQYKKIVEFNKKIFGDENIKITKQILTPEGQKALGAYSEGMIKILKGQADPKDTYYHEVVHKYLDIMTTMEEHKEALIAAKRYFKSKTFEQAEEDLAEAFINYAKKREGVTGALKRIFDKVLSRIKKVESNKQAISDFYDNILKRKVESKPSTKSITPKNIPKKFVPRKIDKTKFTEKLNTSEDVNNLVRKLEKSDAIKRDIQRRGIVTWKETIKQAEEMGIDVSGIRKEAKTASDFAARVEAIKQLRANKASELHDFLSHIPRNPTEKQKAEIARKIDEFLFIDRSLKSISTEHGRAINILKKEVQAEEFEVYNDLIDKILEIDPKKYDELEYVKKIDKAVDNKGEQILNALGITRSMMATADLSAPFRQGVFVAPKHPVMFSKAMKEMFKYAFNEKYYEKAMNEIKSSESYPLMKKAGLALTELDEGLTKREESIISNLPEKIPGFGKIARGSNRAYTGFLNKLRADYFENMVKTMNIVDKDITKERIRDVARYINSATGRGDLPKYVEKHANLLNALFFSPRLIASRMNLLNPHYYYKLDPYVRKEALKDLLAFVATGASVLSLAKIGGAEVGTDPRSADFGKIKIGNTRFDIWGGFQQYAVLASRLISGEMVSSTTGREFQLGEGYKPTTRGDIVRKFFSYKTSPVASFAFGFLNGRNAIGQKFDVPAEVLKRFIPMVTSDFYDLMQEKQPVSYAIPGVFGVGVQTYSSKIPFKEKNSRGKTKIVWKERPDLAESLVDYFRGRQESTIPKSQWRRLYKIKVKRDMEKAKISNAKRKVLETGKPTRINGKRIYLENGVVKVK